VSSRYGRYLGLLVAALGVAVLVNLLLSKSSGVSGIPPGERLAPFAAPLALSTLSGDADIATHANQGAAGKVPACAERGAGILNVCQLYEQGPVVLALFVDAGSCPAILGRMQALVGAFPGVRFAAVAIGGSRAKIRLLLRSRGVSLPVGLDGDGAVGDLYKVVSCPQVDFAYRGGVVQSNALVANPSLARLRARVRELAAAQRARERGGPAA
jgi:hypothetical protein